MRLWIDEDGPRPEFHSLHEESDYHVSLPPYFSDLRFYQKQVEQVELEYAIKDAAKALLAGNYPALPRTIQHHGKYHLSNVESTHRLKVNFENDTTLVCDRVDGGFAGGCGLRVGLNADSWSSLLHAAPALLNRLTN